MDEQQSSALEILQKLTGKIPSGVSYDDFLRNMPLLQHNHGTKTIYDNCILAISATLKQDFSEFWQNYNIEEKLKKLKEIEKASSKTDAWRPTPGTVNANSILANKLLSLKERLKTEIKDIQVVSLNNCQIIKEKSALMESQMQDIKNLEFNN